jgi:hypothetical protein
MKILSQAREDMRELNDIETIDRSGNLKKFVSPTKHAPSI